MTVAFGGVTSFGRGTVSATVADLEREERERGKVFRERVSFGFGKAVGFSAVPAAIIAMKMIAPSMPNWDQHRDAPKMMTTVVAKVV